MGKVKFEGTSRSVTRDDLRVVEARIGSKLPAALAAHYLQHNGGQPDLPWFVGQDDVEYCVAAFAPIKHRSDEDQELLEETYDRLVRRKHVVPPTMIPFAIDEGGHHFCASAASGEIYFLAEDARTARPILVARSLPAMLDALISEDEMWIYEDDEEGVMGAQAQAPGASAPHTKAAPKKPAKAAAAKKVEPKPAARKKATPKTAAAKKASPKKAVARKAVAKKAGPPKKAVAKKAAAKKAAPKKVAKKKAAKKR
jgi:hypothetical protein